MFFLHDSEAECVISYYIYKYVICTYEGGPRSFVARVFTLKKIVNSVSNYVGSLSGGLILKFGNFSCIQPGDMMRCVLNFVFLSTCILSCYSTPNTFPAWCFKSTLKLCLESPYTIV
jgi:hypothetical protein